MTASKSNPKLGRFEIVRELGRGAFGTVYLARDPQLERSVALKLPNVRFKERAGHEDRFLREARAAAGLHHPNIVPIHDAGQLGDYYYIAAAFIEGGTLRDILRAQGRPAPATAVRLVSRLADALGYAHSQGIVHRDVKPENVLLDSQGTPYLTDFGLARRLEEEQQTEKRSLFGTPAYMSPEQAAGKASSGPSDQWALGVMLYELLTGQRPFEGDPVTVLYAVQHTEPDPPRNLVPNLPLDLQAICMKCMSKDPQQRYADCYALAADLERWLADEPVQARPLTLPQRIYRWNRREPLIARLYGLLLLVVTVFGFVLTLLWLHALSLQNVAEKQTAESERNRAIADERKAESDATNKQLLLQKKQLEEKESQLQDKVAELNNSLEALKKAESDRNQAEDKSSQAQEVAQAAERQTVAEQNKNAKLRYFGDILGAGIAISTGQADRALALLSESNTAERSIEWNFLSNLAHSIDQRYALVADFNALNTEQAYSIFSRHFPNAANDQQHIQALRNAQDVLAVSNNARRWLIAKEPVEVLKKHLPPGVHQPRDPNYPDGPEIKAFRVVATEFGGKAIIAQEDVTHAWLSPNGKRACFMVPTIEKRNVNPINVVITVRFQLTLVDLDEPDGQSQLLTEPTVTSYELPIRVIIATGAKDSYSVDIPKMRAQYCGSFSPDSSKFVLFNAQSSQVATWDVSSLSGSKDGLQPLVVSSLQTFFSNGSAPCACHFNDNSIQLSVPEHLIELEANTLTVQNDRKLLAVPGTLVDAVFSHSGSHVAQLSTFTDNRKRTTVWVQLNNCQGSLSQIVEVNPDRLTFCTDISRSLKQRADGKRGGVLMLDWMSSDFIDDPDGEWLSLRLPAGTQLLFEKPLKPEPRSGVIWDSRTKKTPLLIKSSVNDSSILLAYEDRFSILKQETEQKWLLQANREMSDGALLDAEFHAFQDSILVCQPKRVSIFGRSNFAKPNEFALPFRSSLCMVSERTMAFLNQAGELQLASASDGSLGSRVAVHRQGSTCMVVDPRKQIAALANSERTISSVNLTALVAENTTITREIPQRLILNLQANLLCSIGLDSLVSLYAWPKLQRVATFNINNTILYATPSNDGKRLIVVTPAGFQILDNQFALPVLDMQKFSIPAVAAKVTTDQSAIFVYNSAGQLLKYQL